MDFHLQLLTHVLHMKCCCQSIDTPLPTPGLVSYFASVFVFVFMKLCFSCSNCLQLKTTSQPFDLAVFPFVPKVFFFFLLVWVNTFAFIELKQQPVQSVIPQDMPFSKFQLHVRTCASLALLLLAAAFSAGRCTTTLSRSPGGRDMDIFLFVFFFFLKLPNVCAKKPHHNSPPPNPFFKSVSVTHPGTPHLMSAQDGAEPPIRSADQDNVCWSQPVAPTWTKKISAGTLLPRSAQLLCMLPCLH